MKQIVLKIDERELLKNYPIAGRVSGWFFRLRERSGGCWVVEGADEWGRQVFREGDDPDAVLEKCIADAQQIVEQTKTN